MQMSETLSNKSSSISVVACFAIAVSLACAASKDARPSPAGESIPTDSPSVASSTSQAGVVPTGSAASVAAGNIIPSSGASATVTGKTSSSAVSPGGKTSSSTASRAGKDSAANDPPITVPTVKGRTKRDSLELVKAVKAGMKNTDWPVKTPPALPGSILPAHRIVAFYGNPLSKKMGILGELPPDQMLAKFDKEIEAWRKADPTHPVQPALHLIAVVAQGAPGRDGKYRLRMADTLIETVASWAAKKNAILFLDVQVGQSTVQEELPRLVPFLKRPNVHLGIDPEFSMKFGDKPGSKIGTMSSSDVNYAIGLLSDLV